MRSGPKQAKQVTAGDKGEGKAWKLACMERERFACLLCGSTRLLTVHHCWEQAERPDLRRSVANGRTVCSACHQWAHSTEGKHMARAWRILSLQEVDGTEVAERVLREELEADWQGMCDEAERIPMADCPDDEE